MDSVGRWPWLKSPRMSPFSAMEAIQPGGWASWALTFNPASRFPCTPSQLCELPGLVHVGGDNGKASPGPGEASVDTMLIGCIVQPCSRRSSINSGSYFRYYCWIRSSREKKKKEQSGNHKAKRNRLDSSLGNIRALCISGFIMAHVCYFYPLSVLFPIC